MGKRPAKIKPSKVEGRTFPAPDPGECQHCGAPLNGTTQEKHSRKYHRKGYAGPSYTHGNMWRVPASEPGQSATYCVTEDEAQTLWAQQKEGSDPQTGRARRGLEGLC